MSDARAALLRTIGEGLAQLSDDDLRVYSLAVLHGVPITQLSGSLEANRDAVIGAQKQLRKFLSDRGFAAADLEKSARGKR